MKCEYYAARKVLLVVLKIQSETETHLPWLFDRIMKGMDILHIGPFTPLFYTHGVPQTKWICKRCSQLIGE